MDELGWTQAYDTDGTQQFIHSDPARGIYIVVLHLSRPTRPFSWVANLHGDAIAQGASDSLGEAGDEAMEQIERAKAGAQ